MNTYKTTLTPFSYSGEKGFTVVVVQEPTGYVACGRVIGDESVANDLAWRLKARLKIDNTIRNVKSWDTRHQKKEEKKNGKDNL